MWLHTHWLAVIIIAISTSQKVYIELYVVSFILTREVLGILEQQKLVNTLLFNSVCSLHLWWWLFCHWLRFESFDIVTNKRRLS